MLPLDFITLRNRWDKWLRDHFGPPEMLTLPLERLTLRQLALTDEASLPLLVRQSPTAMRYLHLLGDLNRDHFSERLQNRAWPGPTPAPRASCVAAFLVKIEEGKRTCPIFAPCWSNTQPWSGYLASRLSLPLTTFGDLMLKPASPVANN